MIPRIGHWLVLGGIAILALRAWKPPEEHRLIQVFGPSMAPALLGQHDAWTCTQCEYLFNTGMADTAGPAICPNCGCRQSERSVPARRAGDRLQAVFSGKRPQRWEVIVFRCPEGARQPDMQPHSIKRTVGLPGDAVLLRDGDVWINGLRARKSLSQQLAMAIPVHDNRFPPGAAAGVPPAWSPADSASGWKPDGKSFHFAPLESGKARSETDWLHFVRWRSSSGANVFESSAVMDDYGYNRGESRRLHRVDDLLFIARASAQGTGQMNFRGQIDGEDYVVQWNPSSASGQLNKTGSQTALQTFAAKNLPESAEREIIFSLFDHQVTLAVDRQVLLNWPVQNAAGPPARSSQPQILAVGAADLVVQISQLRVLRDVYYTTPRGPDGRWATDAPCRLAADEYFVLGDNSPLSADSRAGWPGPGLPERYILGIVRGR